MSYDEKCYELAEYFANDVSTVTVPQVSELAQHIQTSIEDWLAGLEKDEAAS